MSEANKNLVRRYAEEVATQGKLDVVDEIFAPDFVNHFPTWRGGDSVGSDKLKEFVSGVRGRSLQTNVTIEDMVAEGDRVVARITLRGIGKGDWQGIPADGKPYEMQEIWIFRVARGRLAERWFIADLWSRMKALAAEPVVAK